MYSLSPGASGERTTEFRVIPRVVQRGHNVTMACLYDLQDYEVYSVKWYKETHEFYKFSPLDRPKTKVSHVDGITIDVSIFFLYIYTRKKPLHAFHHTGSNELSETSSIYKRDIFIYLNITLCSTKTLIISQLKR